MPDDREDAARRDAYERLSRAVELPLLSVGASSVAIRQNPSVAVLTATGAPFAPVRQRDDAIGHAPASFLVEEKSDPLEADVVAIREELAAIREFLARLIGDGVGVDPRATIDFPLRSTSTKVRDGAQ
jgi:hypothetical protein